MSLSFHLACLSSTSCIFPLVTKAVSHFKLSFHFNLLSKYWVDSLGLFFNIFVQFKDLPLHFVPFLDQVLNDNFRQGHKLCQKLPVRRFCCWSCDLFRAFLALAKILIFLMIKGLVQASSDSSLWCQWERGLALSALKVDALKLISVSVPQTVSWNLHEWRSQTCFKSGAIMTWILLAPNISHYGTTVSVSDCGHDIFSVVKKKSYATHSFIRSTIHSFIHSSFPREERASTLVILDHLATLNRYFTITFVMVRIVCWGQKRPIKGPISTGNKLQEKKTNMADKARKNVAYKILFRNVFSARIPSRGLHTTEKDFQKTTFFTLLSGFDDCDIYQDRESPRLLYWYSWRFSRFHALFFSWHGSAASFSYKHGKNKTELFAEKTEQSKKLSIIGGRRVNLSFLYVCVQVVPVQKVLGFVIYKVKKTHPKSKFQQNPLFWPYLNVKLRAALFAMAFKVPGCDRQFYATIGRYCTSLRTITVL